MKRMLVALLVCVGALVPVQAAHADRPATVQVEGRWFVDAGGRVVGMRGVNFVQKFPPVSPESVGFDDDDAAFLAAHGFNVVRLGVVFGAVMPQPGRVDNAYVQSIAHTTDVLARHGIETLLDFHQDGYGPAVHGNGFPEWATLTDGLPNPNVDFPLYYILNPALQRAFDNFWLNRNGPDGVPLQTNYAKAVRSVAAAVADQPSVLGYDIMNEPWPGTDWNACLTGCPDLERARLLPFEQRMADAVRSVDKRHPVFAEPWVLFNFGMTATVVPNAGDGLSFHVYTATPSDEPAVVANALAAANARNVPPLATEYGATTDPATIDRIATTIEDGLVPWIFWSYDENLVIDKSKPPAPANVRTQVLAALERPYAAATNGTPESWHYDASAGDVRFSYSTTRADGKRGHPNDETEIVVPFGYRVAVSGARVVSAPCASKLRLRNELFAGHVTVHITKAGCS
jgi:endoglycosylceramidase